MKGLKNEITIIIIGGLLVLLGTLGSNNKQDNNRQKISKHTTTDKFDLNAKNSTQTKSTNKNNRQPASKEKSTDKEIKKNNSINAVESSGPKGLSKIKKTILCLESENCSYPNNDPREYSLEVHQDLAHQIKIASVSWKKNWSKFSSSEQDEVMNLFSLESGYTKENMLTFLNSLETPDAANYYDVVVDNVLKNHNANLIDDTVNYLKKIRNGSNENKIASDVAETIKSGSPFVSEALSKHSTSFITQQTEETFKTLSKSLPKNSSESLNIEAALIEFDMVSTGG